MSHVSTASEDGPPEHQIMARVGGRAPSCPLCDSERLRFMFGNNGHRVEGCVDCGFRLLNPQPANDELRDVRVADSLVSDAPMESPINRATARAYLQQIARYGAVRGGRLLEIGCGPGDFLDEAAREGYELTAVELSPSAASRARARVPSATVHCDRLENIALPPGSFDVCVLCDVLEHVREPVEFVRKVQRLLRPGGVLFLATPTLDSWTARLLGRRWSAYKSEHLSYFNTQTIQNILYDAGFRDVVVSADRKALTLNCVTQHFRRFPVPLLTPLLAGACRLVPNRWRDRQMFMAGSGMAVCASAGASDRVGKRPCLSVVVPVYNEIATVDTLLNALLQKNVTGMDLEVIVVESGSTDGSRECVERFRHHPRVTVVYEDQPRGKGHAVRTGFQYAMGDYILIQDADLEYDLDDYDSLLEPLRQGRASLVLGARHGGSAFKMRQFQDQPLLGSLLNAGHWFFTTLLNVLFGQRLKDPFTMYKVFRRDCLAGLTFSCNRFDFDFELLIKLLRKGYRPLEVPVNYRSRSFNEGKKVSVLRDPLTWLWALLWLRTVRIDPVREIGRQRSQEKPAAARCAV
jgi:2-polyprenyl-3-methyl-5-hydroxy-6-metoxy-1,4-benzoquinol methylase